MSTADAPTDTLTGAEREAIAALARQVPVPRAAAITALLHVQRQRGFIADGILGEIAGALAMSVAALDEVATFYNLIFRRPVGERVILLCDSVTCWMLGQPALAAHLQARLGVRPGETSADGRYTLLPIVCLGACDRAPALLCGGTLHGELDPARLDELFGLAPA